MGRLTGHGLLHPLERCAGDEGCSTCLNAKLRDDTVQRAVRGVNGVMKVFIWLMFISGILRWYVVKQGILELETEKNRISYKGRVRIVLEIRKERETAADNSVTKL